MTVRANGNGLAWGFSTLGCPEYSLAQACELLNEFSMSNLEIRALDGRMDLPQWAVDSNWPPNRAKALLQKHAVQFRVAGSSFKLVENDERSRAEMLSFCQWANSWGAQYVRTFGGGEWGRPLTEAEYDHAARSISWWRQKKKERGWRVDLVLETHDAFSASSPCLNLFARLRQPIGVIWDSHHTWRVGGEPLRETWSKLSHCLRHVHIKDSIAKPSARHPFTYVLPGDGDVPLSEIIDLLREHTFTGMVSLEWERLWHPYLPPLRDALMRLQALPYFLGSAPSVHEHESSAVPR